MDRCVECGYCEPVCPSRDLTTTPRQRIVLRREMARAREAGDTALVAELRAGVRLRRGRHLRGGRHVPDGVPGADQHRRPDEAVAVRGRRPGRAGRLEDRRRALERRDPGGVDGARRGRGAAVTAGAGSEPAGAHGDRPRRAAAVVDGAAGRRCGRPRPVSARGSRPAADRDTVDAVYFAACVGTMFGPADGGPGVRSAFETLCERAGLTLRYPEDCPVCAAGRRGSPRA